MIAFPSLSLQTLRTAPQRGWRRPLVLMAGILLAVQVQAQSPEPAAAAKTANQNTAAAQPDAHTRADIERHRAMAKAHEAAAQCLASGAGHDACEKQLQADCKGLALGKHCGMRHAH